MTSQKVNSVKVSPDQLVSMPPLTFDQTLDLWEQNLRFDFIVGGPALRVQLTLDRRHMYHRKLSRPVAYFHISDTGLLLDLAKQALAAAAVLALYPRTDALPPDTFEVTNAIDSALNLIRSDIIHLTYIYLKKVKEREIQLKTKKLLKVKA